MEKIVYKDGELPRALKGTITHEDDYFLYVESNGTKFRIGKGSVIKVEELRDE